MSWLVYAWGTLVICALAAIALAAYVIATTVVNIAAHLRLLVQVIDRAWKAAEKVNERENKF